MKISLNWLKEYTPLEAFKDELETVLPMLGLEVTSVTHTGMPQIDSLVVGEIVSYGPHPNADRLKVCLVKSSLYKRPLQIVCGATNYKLGDRVPVALPGCRLPEGVNIAKRHLRGIESHGMLCSAKELGLGEDDKGLLILPKHPELGTPLNELFPEQDTIFELELTANRGDCLSQIGVARELAAYFDLKLYLPEPTVYESQDESLLTGVDIQTENCPYYTAWTIRGVRIEESPNWLKHRLESVGLRPINNIVDVTNYVLMQTGQPLHAFDHRKMQGDQLIVRQASPGETIITLDHKKHTLEAEDVVVADAQKPLAIAGVMGSLIAEVDALTTDIVLESAWFRPDTIRRTSRRHNLHTDSAYRFARDVDPAGVDRWGHYAIGLILQVAGGKLTGPRHVQGQHPRKDRKIEIDGDYLRQICGYPIANDAITGVFSRLGFSVNASPSKASQTWTVQVPSFRAGIEHPIDLVGEWVRIGGTSNIPNTQVNAPGLHREDAPLAVFNQRVQDLLVARQFQECCHYSLCDAQTLKGSGCDEIAGQALSLANPLTHEMSHLRSSLIPELLNTLRLNRSHNNPTRRLFETGQIFQGDEAQVTELSSVAFIIGIDEPERSWLEREKPDFYTVKSLLDLIARWAGVEPETLPWKALQDATFWQAGQAAQAKLDTIQARAGFLSIKTLKTQTIDGLVLAGECCFPYESLTSTSTSTIFQPFSEYPASKRDLALVVNQEEPASKVKAQLKAAAEKATGKAFTAENITIFDVYSAKGLPKNKKSLGFSITFRSMKRTLKEKEVNTAFGKIQNTIKETGYAIRE